MSARGVDLDILECTDDPAAVRELNVVVPSDVTINGLPVLVPKDTTVEIEATVDGLVVARLSMFVGKLRVHAERPPLDEPTPIYYEAREHVYGFAG